jgi:hypothetical protein
MLQKLTERTVTSLEQKNTWLSHEGLTCRPPAYSKVMNLQELCRLLKGRRLQIKRHNLPFWADRFRQCKGITSFAGGQINRQVTRLQYLADQLLAPGDDTGQG